MRPTILKVTMIYAVVVNLLALPQKAKYANEYKTAFEDDFYAIALIIILMICVCIYLYLIAVP